MMKLLHSCDRCLGQHLPYYHQLLRREYGIDGFDGVDGCDAGLAVYLPLQLALFMCVRACIMSLEGETESISMRERERKTATGGNPTRQRGEQMPLSICRRREELGQ